MVVKRSKGEKVFNVFNILVMIIMIIITVYPFWYCVTCSLSKNIVGNSASLMLLPKKLSFAAYASVLSNPNILNGYKVTIFVVAAGTAINMAATTVAAFLLTRKNFAIKGFLTYMMLFTMYFSGGMIPTYIIYNNVLGLGNNLLVLLIPGAISVYNMIVMRTNFEAIPPSLEESVRIDGGNDLHILWHITVPLSKATMAVMILFYGVGHWNSWFNAMLYIKNPKLIPLQLALRSILLQEEIATNAGAADSMGLSENIKYATIVAATVPILLIYPFIQKYFIKGMMIGAVKG